MPGSRNFICALPSSLSRQRTSLGSRPLRRMPRVLRSVAKSPFQRFGFVFGIETSTIQFTTTRGARRRFVKRVLPVCLC